MELGLIILIIIASVIVIHFFGFLIFWWCVFATILIVIGVFFYQIFESEGRFKKFKEWRKRMWKKYLKIGRKFFDWLDKI
jgi:hypothetical protein